MKRILFVFLVISGVLFADDHSVTFDEHIEFAKLPLDIQKLLSQYQPTKK